jgi:integrase
MKASNGKGFERNYALHLQHLKLKGLQPKTIEAYSRAIRRIGDAKGNRDRFVPMPHATHQLLRRFWQVHRNPVLLFPNRHGGRHGAASALSPMDPGGVQTTLHKVVEACGLKKRSPRTA